MTSHTREEEPKEENFAYKNPDGVVTEYRFLDGKFIGLFNDGVKKKENPLQIGRELNDLLRKNLAIAGFFKK